MIDLLFEVIEFKAICDMVDVAAELTVKGALIVADTAKDISGAIKYVRKENKNKRVAGVDPLQFNYKKI
jgi:hypothetical protein